MDILFTWTDKYPELNKVKEAYNMLRTQGVVHEPQKNVIKSNSKKSSMDTQMKLMESDKFRRLLQSKNQKDIEAANLMIQNMVRDNDRRIQMQNRRLMDLQSANENSILLKEILDEFEPTTADEDMMNTLKQIYNSCLKLKPTVMRLADEMHESETFTSKIMETCDALNSAVELYTAIIINKSPVVKKVLAQQNPKVINNLLDVDQPENTTQEIKSTPNDDGSLSELNDIFSVAQGTSIASAKIDTILTPQVISVASNSTNASNSIDLMALINQRKPSTSSNDLPSTFVASQQSPVRIINNAAKSPEKLKASLSEWDSIVSSMKSKLLVGDEPETIKTPSNDSDDDHNLISDEASFQPEIKVNDGLEMKVNDEPEIIPQIKHKLALKDINLDINDIQPSEIEPPRIILDERKGLKVLVNFTKDRPAKDVTVLVITVVNQGHQSISNFQFDGSVAKPCKLRILKASGTNELPGVKPFKPPTETINQVLLLLNPTHEPINMVTILTYNTEDDPDPIKESIEVKDIPFNC